MASGQLWNSYLGGIESCCGRLGNWGPSSGDPTVAEFQADADNFTPNVAELAQLTGITVSDNVSARCAAKKLLLAGARRIIVPPGAVGALLAGPKRMTPIPSVPVDAVDSTAAGDAFNGALAWVLGRGGVTGKPHLPEAGEGVELAAANTRPHDPISRVPFAMLTTNDSTAFERAKFNKDFSAFCKCVGTDLIGDFVPAKSAVLSADQVAYSFTDGSSGDVVHRGSLADFSRSMGRIVSSGRWNIGNW
ncbi:MAG TPA: PfkB family carbohydrate kinase [Pirellulales bacterium]|nr:PfkB family carbohydrate kinase [Pirellulales bacterium]